MTVEASSTTMLRNAHLVACFRRFTSLLSKTSLAARAKLNAIGTKSERWVELWVSTAVLRVGCGYRTPTGGHEFRQRFNREADIAAASRLGRRKVQTVGEIGAADFADEARVATHDELIA